MIKIVVDCSRLRYVDDLLIILNASENIRLERLTERHLGTDAMSWLAVKASLLSALTCFEVYPFIIHVDFVSLLSIKSEHFSRPHNIFQNDVLVISSRRVSEIL